MSLQYPCNRVRVALDVKARPGTAIDANTGSLPEAYWGADLQVEVALFQNGELLDVSNFDTLVMAMKPFDDWMGAYIINPTALLGIDNTVTQETWDDGSKQHLLLRFAKEDIKTIPMNDSKEFKVICPISGPTNTGLFNIYGAFSITFINSGAYVP